MTVNAYQNIRKASLVEGASPHQLIALLYDAGLSNIAIAREHLKQKNRAGMHTNICLLYTSPSPRDRG